MIADRRMYRTADGLALVEGDDVRAATLAYAVGDEVSEADAARMTPPDEVELAEPAEDLAFNVLSKPAADKMVRRRNPRKAD